MTYMSDYLKAAAEGDSAGAVKALNSAISTAATNGDVKLLPQLYCNRCYWRLRQELLRKALQDADAALCMQPDMLSALLYKGDCLQRMGKTQEAVAVWGEALSNVSITTAADTLAALHARIRGDVPAAAAAPTSNGVALPTTPNAASESDARTQRDAASKPTAAHVEALPQQKQPPVRQDAAPPSPAPSAGAATALSNGAVAPDSAQQKSATTAAAGASKAAAAAVTAGEKKAAAASKAADKAAAAKAVSKRAVADSKPTLLQQLEDSRQINECIAQINSGMYAVAEKTLDAILKRDAANVGAYIARGTSKALRRELKAAITDFSAAIDLAPEFADTWKRRGQARAAMGDTEGALSDLHAALQRTPNADAINKADIHFECGTLYQKCRNYRRARGEFEAAVKLNGRVKTLWNACGLMRVSMGDIDDGVAAYDAAIALDAEYKEAYLNKAQALKEQCRVKAAEEAFVKATALDRPPNRSLHGYRILAQMRQGQGEHRKAIQVIDKVLDWKRNEQRIELLFVKAICHHALGEHRKAYDTYNDCLNQPTPDVDTPEETRQMQFLSFYQREIAAYQRSKIDILIDEFCFDRDLSPRFKCDWCKKCHPQIACYPTYPVPPATGAVTRPPPVPTDALQPLLTVADAIGQLLQYSHQGFLPNKRQQRAAGFAAVELAQTVLNVVAARASGKEVWVKSQGASGGVGGDGRHLFGWRDAMDIVVRWRQLSEPNDQVVWVDLLTPEEFEQGFGSHTPMFSGQTKCVRYYMNFARAFAMFKRLLLEAGCSYDANNKAVSVGDEDNKKAVEKAKDCGELYACINADSWVVVPIDSCANATRQLEGTRLTLVKFPSSSQPDAFEFSIRTPVTPKRWNDFDKELEAAWDALIDAMAHGDKQAIAQRILAFTFYWYNFMPLARGTAAVGYTSILALFMAAGMPVISCIPRDVQTDWEAILNTSPSAFAASVSSWLLPPQAKGVEASESDVEKQRVFNGLPSLPRVLEVLPTMRYRLEALNHPADRRI